MSPKLRAARYRRRVSIGIWMFFAAAWAANFATDAAIRVSAPVDADLRVIALAATIGAVNSIIVSQLLRSNELSNRNNELLRDAYGVLKDLQDRRPDPEASLTPLPWRGLRSVDGGEPRNGQHASQ